HETPASTTVDAEWDEILEMPSRSAWPPLVALSMAGVFTMVLLQQWLAAAVFTVILALGVAGFHLKEPEEA
ncbi:MAG TPA: hypothetical protein VFN82_07460, partial [Solirubrobacterales bacterium]|nr:hypothetical protein [Solirubrobacterales bacterium]